MSPFVHDSNIHLYFSTHEYYHPFVPDMKCSTDMKFITVNTSFLYSPNNKDPRNLKMVAFLQNNKEACTAVS